MESKFDPDAFFAGHAVRPIPIAETREEVRYGLKRLHEKGGPALDRVATNMNLEKHPQVLKFPRHLKPLIQKTERLLAISIRNGDITTSDGTPSSLHRRVIESPVKHRQRTPFCPISRSS